MQNKFIKVAASGVMRHPGNHGVLAVQNPIFRSMAGVAAPISARLNMAMLESWRRILPWSEIEEMLMPSTSEKEKFENQGTSAALPGLPVPPDNRGRQTVNC